MMLRSHLDSIDQVEVLDVVSRLNTNRGDRVHQNISVSLSLVFDITVRAVYV